VDYNQNAGAGRLLRLFGSPKPRAPVSAPVTWKEVQKGSRSPTSASTIWQLEFAGRGSLGAFARAAGPSDLSRVV
jgi:DNA primase